ncbi:MAG: conjugal transfer protein TraF [Elusimicrobia bacterium]|nr:conjugal transfer protein TraF [Elusimicrobiota bacterium]
MKQNKRQFFLFIIAALTLFFRNELYSAFVDLGAGARPLGMGGAFVAVADDANTIMYNAAGVTQLDREELTATYTKLYTGIDGLSNNFVAYVYPMGEKLGALGFGWYNFTTKDLYNENTVILSYGSQFSPMLSAGLNLKYLSKQYITNEWTESNPVFSNGNSASGISLDLGVLYSASDVLSLGFSAENFNSPDIGLKSTDKVPANICLGAAYYLTEHVSTALDIAFRNDLVNVNIGCESKVLNDNLALRFGYGNNALTVGAGCLVNIKQTLEGQIDYAFNSPLKFVDGGGGSHQISLSMRFGEPKATAEEAAAEETTTEAAVETPKATEETETPKAEGQEAEKTAAPASGDIKENIAAGIEFYKLGKYLKALDEFNKALETDDKNKQCLKYLKKMTANMEKMKKTFRTEAELVYAKGYLYYANNETIKAVAQWDRLITIEPDNDEVKEYLDKLKNDGEAK